jgi:DNA-binding transcriptional MocR family regulator
MELRLNVPPPAPSVGDAIQAAFTDLRAAPEFGYRLSYGTTAGRLGDRAAASRWLAPLLGATTPDEWVIAAGGAAASAAFASTYLKAGDAVVTEALTYPGIRAVSRHFGLRLLGAEIDGEGVVPSSLEAICRAHAPRALYCTPTIHNPTTATMSPVRRRQIVDVARRHDLMIFEDDAYGLLPRAPSVPLAVLAPERTFYLASLSKCLNPGLRIAFCRPPQAELATFTEGLRVLTFLAPQLLAGVAARLIDGGGADRILGELRSESEARYAIAETELAGWGGGGHPQGPHYWLPVGAGHDIPALGERLRADGIAAKGDGFAVENDHPAALRIALGAYAERADLTRALVRLRDILGDLQRTDT